MKSITYTRKKIKKELQQELEMLNEHIDQLKSCLFSSLSRRAGIKEKLKFFDNTPQSEE